MFYAAFFLAILSISPFARAQIFKCETSNGFVFTDMPCANHQGKVIIVRPNILNSAEGRQQNNLLAKQAAEREYREAMEARALSQLANSQKSGISKEEATRLYKEASTKRPGESRADFETRSRATIGILSASGGAPSLSKEDKEAIYKDATTKRRGESSKDFRTRSEAASSYLGAPQPPQSSTNTSEQKKLNMPPPSVITSCDAGGCWDNTGGRYTRGAGNTFFSNSGACQKVGTTMQCP